MTDVPLHRIDIAAAAQPALVVAGKLWFDTVASRLKIYNGATFDEYTINTDVDDKIDIHRAEVSAHEAVNLDVDTSACSFTSASDLQTFTDDIGVNFYDKYVMEHDYATGVHGPNVTITTTTGDSLSIVTDTTAIANAALRVVTTSGGVKALYIDSSISAESVNVLHNKSAYASPTVRIASTTNGYATVITQGGAGKALYTSGAAECNISSTASADPVLAVGNSGQGYGVVVNQNNTAATDAIRINNSSSGYDVRGNSGNWTVDNEGNAVFATVKTQPSIMRWDSGYFKEPALEKISITHGAADADIFTAYVRSYVAHFNTFSYESFGRFTTPCLGSYYNTHVTGYSELDTTTVKVSHNTGGGMTSFYANSIGEGYNLTSIVGDWDRRLVAIKFPDSATVWDSGWVAVANNANYAFNHTLGVYPNLVWVEIAQNNDGSGWRVPSMSSITYNGASWSGSSMHTCTSTQIQVRTGTTFLASFPRYSTGLGADVTNGFMRVVAAEWTPDYDSGWQSISNAAGNRNKWIFHNLGTEPTLVYLQLAQNVDGSGWSCHALGNIISGFTQGTLILDFDKHNLVIKGGATYLARFLDAAGAQLIPTVGYYRLELWK